jgi:hypothetical protein
MKIAPPMTMASMHPGMRKPIVCPPMSCAFWRLFRSFAATKVSPKGSALVKPLNAGQSGERNNNPLMLRSARRARLETCVTGGIFLAFGEAHPSRRPLWPVMRRAAFDALWRAPQDEDCRWEVVHPSPKAACAKKTVGAGSSCGRRRRAQPQKALAKPEARSEE